MLRIGNKRAFTLVEVLAATVVLALGVTLIYEAFFASLNVFSYYENYLKLSSLMEEKIWIAQANLSQSGVTGNLDLEDLPQEVTAKFDWQLSSALVDESDEAGLYKIRLAVSAKNNKRSLNFARSVYALFKKE